MVANERQFQLKAMLQQPIEKFVQYYQIDEMSESDDNDFEEDGVTMQSGFNGPIILRANEDAESLLIASNSEEEVKLNMSLGTDSRRRPRSPTAESEANQARRNHTQLLRLFL